MLASCWICFCSNGCLPVSGNQCRWCIIIEGYGKNWRRIRKEPEGQQQLLPWSTTYVRQPQHYTAWGGGGKQSRGAQASTGSYSTTSHKCVHSSPCVVASKSVSPHAAEGGGWALFHLEHIGAYIRWRFHTYRHMAVYQRSRGKKCGCTIRLGVNQQHLLFSRVARAKKVENEDEDTAALLQCISRYVPTYVHDTPAKTRSFATRYDTQDTAALLLHGMTTAVYGHIQKPQNSYRYSSTRQRHPHQKNNKKKPQRAPPPNRALALGVSRELVAAVSSMKSSVVAPFGALGRSTSMQ